MNVFFVVLYSVVFTNRNVILFRLRHRIYDNIVCRFVRSYVRFFCNQIARRALEFRFLLSLSAFATLHGNSDSLMWSKRNANNNNNSNIKRKTEMNIRVKHGTLKLIQLTGNKKWKGDKDVLNTTDKKIHFVCCAARVCIMKRPNETLNQVNCSHCSTFTTISILLWVVF